MRHRACEVGDTDRRAAGAGEGDGIRSENQWFREETVQENAAGKVKRWQAGKRHNAGPKSRKRINSLKGSTGFSVPKMERKYKNV
eukprot:CAMPEP_0119501798 /NCGR_PEP_ID=MMETSP1344-20130328/23499_1 /TAXON_ID=236787 /ORGANISM="Florenciella parvula, Strain CCMP2471" /LENGTH=84 /DNA_ID=CAMNT_0007537973 /DNA_START=142 /DNA_END=394 /DNA_ORIENTATION=-